MKKNRRWLNVALICLLLIWVLHRPIVDAVVDWMWFDAVGFNQVFHTRLAAKLGLWTAGVTLTALLVGGNLAKATREAPIDFRKAANLVLDRGVPIGQLKFAWKVIKIGWVAVPCLLFGAAFMDQWMQVLSAVRAHDFGVVDPVFARDVGFYIFKLPAIESLQNALAGLLGITVLPLTGFYFVRDVLVGQNPGLSKKARTHLLVLSALFFVVLAWGWHLKGFGLLYERRGVVWGMGYADDTGALPAYWVMIGVSLLTSVALLVATRMRGWRFLVGAFGLYAVSWLLLVGVWPDALQSYYVLPTELQVEAPYLERNIHATRAAYKLDEVEVRAFPADTTLTADDIANNPLTVENIRIWDDRPLLTTYAQIQEIRPYYNFKDVDVDRYEIDGTLRQVMLSARELNYERVESKSWVNEHFQYTHGYGLTLSPVNVVTPEGLPDLFIQDIPPVHNTELEMAQPAIYYGEMTDRYVFVNTSTDEFDYPDGENNAYTRYAGEGGVKVGGFGRKALLAMYFSSFDIVLSQYLEKDSRVLFKRTVHERVRTVAPFLEFDADPYPVLMDDRMVWIVDAYTWTSRYPYSEPLGNQGRAPGMRTPMPRRANYLRNSVKVVVDAYDGSMDFYIAEPDDPIIQTYAEIFPGMFQPLSDLPEELSEHLRYPQDYFMAQARMYARYHMNNTGVFYNSEDLWDIPKEKYSGKEQTMEAYYLIMKLPEGDAAEFVLLIPFVPAQKQNMISWLAARSDGDDYGKLVLYQFPKQKLIFGPMQIESRIDQDPEISPQLSLWNQGGSSVNRGNLLVIPIEDSLLYVEPLYLEADKGRLPELKRVLVIFENRIAMEPTLDLAMAAIFDTDAPAIEVELGDPEQPGGAPSGVYELVGQARDVYLRSQQAMQSGDWTAYGAAMDELGGLLERLEQETPQPEVVAPEVAPPAPSDDAQLPE